MVNRIREARKAKGFTMKQLGTAVDVAESTISQYETGKREPDNKTLLKISEVLNVSVDYLLGKTDIKKDPAGQGDRPAMEQEFDELWEKLTPKQRKNILDLMKSFLRNDELEEKE